MPRVTYVKKARKDNPAVSAGESYYWWKFRYGGKHYSRTQPRQSQLTQSAYFGTVYGMLEQVEDFECKEACDVESLVDELRSSVDELRDETQGSLDNMPESLMYSPTGELLQERVEALDNVECELDNVEEFDFEEEEYDEDEPCREDYDDEDDYEMELNDWKADKAAHESNESERHDDEFESWVDESKSTLSDAIDQAIV